MPALSASSTQSERRAKRHAIPHRSILPDRANGSAIKFHAGLPTPQSQQMAPTRLVAATIDGINLGELGTHQENLG